MAAAGLGGPDPDLYQLLGVPRDACREQVARAWRRRARAVHPDARPRDAAVPGVRPPGPPLWVGPVRVQGAQRARAAGGWDEREAGLAGLAGWYLAGARDRRW